MGAGFSRPGKDTGRLVDTPTLHARIQEATWELKDHERRLEVQAADLERMNTELRALNQNKDHLMGIVVHDLRNPLTGIVLALDLLSEETDLALPSASRRALPR